MFFPGLFNINFKAKIFNLVCLLERLPVLRTNTLVFNALCDGLNKLQFVFSGFTTSLSALKQSWIFLSYILVSLARVLVHFPKLKFGKRNLLKLDKPRQNFREISRTLY